MIKINFVISLGVLITFFNVHFAQGADPAVDNAVKDTQELLKNKSQRQEVINRDLKAKAADNQVKAVTGGDTQQSEQIYGISAEIMPALMQSVVKNPAMAM